MPLTSYSSDEALQHIKQNRFAFWPQRGEGNRIEPIARLRIDAKFTIEPNSSIFTVGSCFARTVESFLISAGFKVPMREIFLNPAFVNLQAELINNYSTPSIYNEFNWALNDEDHFDQKLHFFEIENGLFIDLHLGMTLKPQPISLLEERRRIVRQAYRRVLDCQTIILTLGLSEVWFDSLAGCYLNHMPARAALDLAPDRFRLQVLSYDEVREYIFKTLDLLYERCPEKPRIILTVSPVPLTATFRPIDVAVANSYTKSVLRTVAEEAISKYEGISYYPGYESVLLSNRDRTWMSDQVHVTNDVIAVQVVRMLQAYAPHVKITDYESLAEAEIVEKSKSAMPALEARLFFQEYGEKFNGNQDFLVEYIKHLLLISENYKATMMCRELTRTDQEADFLKAKCLRLNGQPEEALKLLEGWLGPNQRTYALWDEIVRDASLSKNLPLALRLVDQWCTHMPFTAHLALVGAAKILAATDTEAARGLYRRALERNPEDKAAQDGLQQLAKTVSLETAV